MEEACVAGRGQGLLQMASLQMNAYMAGKMHDVKESVALYAVSADLDGITLASASSAKGIQRAAAMFATAIEGVVKKPQLVAAVVMSAMNGISCWVLEAKSPERGFVPLQQELAVMVYSYLRTCAASRVVEVVAATPA